VRGGSLRQNAASEGAKQVGEADGLKDNSEARQRELRGESVEANQQLAL
jgi:hypothetical protein